MSKDNDKNGKFIKFKQERIGKESYNKQGCLMKCIRYDGHNDITVEFQDNWKAKVYTSWKCFCSGSVKNPFFPSVYGVGIVGDKYICSVDGKHTKEYDAWRAMLTRCYNKKLKESHNTYNEVVCCEEWLYFPNFYEWIHNQENFEKWYNNKYWELDKDILIKGNKIYSPDTCCLVPSGLNNLFTKSNNIRGNLPIGVTYSSYRKRYQAQCQNPLTNKHENLGYYKDINKAFNSYKKFKEDIIKQVAQKEYDKGNITKKCYEAMMRYEVEITD